MQRSEIGLMVMTFLMGAVLGGYVYITGIWTSQNDLLPGSAAWEIRGEEAGQCERSGTCRFVYVDATGSYRYTSGNVAVASSEQLPSSAVRDLAVLVNATDFESFQSVADCDLDAVDRWYRYSVESDSQVVTYRTCAPTVAEAPLNEYLARLWDESAQYATGDRGEFVYRILHDPDSTWLSNFRLIRFKGTE